MRKTQVALAALALVASSAAVAEGVAVYGRLDTSVAKSSGQATQMNHSTWDTSLFGIKGTEDLGGGLTASFNLEGGLNTATGEAHNPGTVAGVFNRQSNITLSSNELGAIKLGTQLSPFIAGTLTGVATNNASFYVPLLAMGIAVSPTGYFTNDTNRAENGAAATGGFFIPNSVSYTTPVISGFQGSALTQIAGAGERRQVAGTEYQAASLTYGADDLKVAFSYESNGGIGAVLDVVSGQSATKTKIWSLGGTYNMGPAKVGLGYISHDPNTASLSRLNVWHTSLSYSVTQSLTGVLGYARSNRGYANILTGVTDVNRLNDSMSQITAGFNYALSKRTYTYAHIARGNNGAGVLYGVANTGTNGDSTGYAIGVGHNF